MRLSSVAPFLLLFDGSSFNLITSVFIIVFSIILILFVQDWDCKDTKKKSQLVKFEINKFTIVIISSCGLLLKQWINRILGFQKDVQILFI